MPRFLLSFDDGAMDHIPAADMPEVSVASRAVVRDAEAAGVWVYGLGVHRQQATIVDTDGSVTDGPAVPKKAVIGGFSIIDVASRAEAIAWAARFAAACRCAQEVREIMDDPEA